MTQLLMSHAGHFTEFSQMADMVVFFIGTGTAGFLALVHIKVPVTFATANFERSNINVSENLLPETETL